FGGGFNAFLSITTFAIAQITRLTALYLIPIYLILAIGYYAPEFARLLAVRRYGRLLILSSKCSAYAVTSLLVAALIINIGFSFEKTFTRFGDYQFKSASLNSLKSLAFLKEMPVPLPYAYVKVLDYGKYKQETGVGNGPPYLMGNLGRDGGFK